MTICHAIRKGGYIGSHWPNHVRASALLDGSTSEFRIKEDVKRLEKEMT